MARQVGNPKGAKARADKLFSQIIRARGMCEACGTTDYDRLQCAHIVSRRFANTRCDEDNALCLCAKDHLFFTDHPVAFGQFVIGLIGEPAYDQIHARAHESRKIVWLDVVQRLKLRAKELELV